MGTFNLRREELNAPEILGDDLAKQRLLIAEKKLSLKTDWPADLPLVWFDNGAFRLIIENLIANAIRYTPAGGRIALAIKKEGKNLVVSVSDTGCGIPKDEAGRIFTKLFRATNAQEIARDGEGLGLYLAKSIADQAGARLWFEANASGPGTTFYLSLPIEE
jgi:signal transduction histidine kinase